MSESSSVFHVEANPLGALWALPSPDAELMYPSKVDKFSNRVLCVEMSRLHNADADKKDFRIKEYYRMFLPMHPTRKYTKLVLGLAFPWMSTCEIMERCDPGIPPSGLGMCEFPMVSLMYVRTPYNICAVYLQYLRDDVDIFDLDHAAMYSRLRLENMVFGFRKDRVQKEFRFSPPLLVAGPDRNLTIIGSQSGKLVTPDVVAISIVVQKACNGCGASPTVLNAKDFKRCSGCVKNGQMASWYCSKECQRLDYRFHKAACTTPHGSRELQSRLTAVVGSA
jgi:hypothetical protein